MSKARNTAKIPYQIPPSITNTETLPPTMDQLVARIENDYGNETLTDKCPKTSGQYCKNRIINEGCGRNYLITIQQLTLEIIQC